MALEKTTDETMDDLRRFTAAHKYLEPTDRLLRRADLVKFAKYQPTIPEHEEMLTTAFDIVNGTKVIEVTPVEDNSGNRPASGKPAYAGAVHGGQNGEGEMKNV